MQWWLRFLVTLVLSPLLYQAVAAYIGSQTGADFNWATFGQGLEQLYIALSLPGFVLVLVVLWPADFVLRRIGLGLLSLVVSPILGAVIPLLIVRFVPDLRVQALAPAIPLFCVYGLVWGLTTREPRARRGDPAVSTA